jgi:sugar phosphate isomerase/epimerase
MQLGIGLEFARARSVSFEQAAELAAQAGYRFIEPYVYSPASLQLNSHLSWVSQSGYHHLNTTETDIDRTQALMQALNLQFSAFDAHSTLLMPHVGIPYITSAIDMAADLGCPIVMTDEGPVPLDWIDLNRAFDLMCFSLEQIIAQAHKRRVRLAIELHNALTTHPKYLAMLLRRFGPNDLGVNFDTGNAFLAGNEPVEMLQAIADRVIHVHIKDIPEAELPMRGKVTGTRVGVATGDGVLDLRSILNVLAAAGYAGVLSVECDTWEQAQRSRQHLARLVSEMKDSSINQEQPRPSGQFTAAVANRIASTSFGS